MRYFIVVFTSGKVNSMHTDYKYAVINAESAIVKLGHSPLAAQDAIGALSIGDSWTFNDDKLGAIVNVVRYK